MINLQSIILQPIEFDKEKETCPLYSYEYHQRFERCGTSSSLINV